MEEKPKLEKEIRNKRKILFLIGVPVNSLATEMPLIHWLPVLPPHPTLVAYILIALLLAAMAWLMFAPLDSRAALVTSCGSPAPLPPRNAKKCQDLPRIAKICQELPRIFKFFPWPHYSPSLQSWMVSCSKLIFSPFCPKRCKFRFLPGQSTTLLPTYHMVLLNRAQLMTETNSLLFSIRLSVTTIEKPVGASGRTRIATDRRSADEVLVTDRRPARRPPTPHNTNAAR